MARKRVVSRTIEEVTVNAMCCDIINECVINKEFTLGGGVAVGDELKIAQKRYNTPSLQVVSILSVKRQDVLYEMDEIDFIQNARRVEGGR